MQAEFQTHISYLYECLKRAIIHRRMNVPPMALLDETTVIMSLCVRMPDGFHRISDTLAKMEYTESRYEDPIIPIQIIVITFLAHFV